MSKYRHIAVPTTYDVRKDGKEIKVTLKMDQIVEGSFINKTTLFADLSLDDGTEIFGVCRESFKSSIA